MIRFVLPCLLLMLILGACEKNITIKLDPSTTNLVVDASIENGKFPIVSLSTSLDYFSKIDPEILAAHFVHHAQVTMSNGRITAALVEDSVLNDSSGIYIYYYTFQYDTIQKFKGEFNTTYNLQIVVDQQTYTATTTIPSIAKKIDSLWWEPAPNNSDSDLVNVKGRITDPPGLGNYTRYFTSVNNGPFLPGQTSVYDDQITDGTTYSVIIPQGIDRNQKQNANTQGFFNRGEQVIIELANIDKATFDFWRTMEYNYSSVGNPFSTPTKVISNISNGALGYFGGYAAQYSLLLIPR